MNVTRNVVIKLIIVVNFINLIVDFRMQANLRLKLLEKTNLIRNMNSY